MARRVRQRGEPIKQKTIRSETKTRRRQGRKREPKTKTSNLPKNSVHRLNRVI